MVFVCLLSILISAPNSKPLDLGSIHYFKCISANVKEEYIFQSDSNIFYQEFAEQWSGNRKPFGHLETWDSVVTIYSNKLGYINYIQDSVQEFKFLINGTEYKKWIFIKDKLRESFVHDGEIMSIESFNPTSEDRSRLLQKIKYDISIEAICASDILVELPPEILAEIERYGMKR